MIFCGDLSIEIFYNNSAMLPTLFIVLQSA
jgi:hypothetical protein